MPYIRQQHNFYGYDDKVIDLLCPLCIWCCGMNQIRYIRTKIFGMTQAEFADVIRSDQSTVSRLENDIRGLDQEKMLLIRAAAKRRRLAWNDTWFFEAAA